MAEHEVLTHGIVWCCRCGYGWAGANPFAFSLEELRMLVTAHVEVCNG